MPISLKNRPLALMRIIKTSSGFTLIELMIALIILGVIIAISFSIYRTYLDKAKITLAQSALNNAQKDLEIYFMDNKEYPLTINFPSCTDGNGLTVFDPTCCSQLNSDLYSIDNYTSNGSTSYVLTARAQDTNNTLIQVTEKTLTVQGN